MKGKRSLKPLILVAFIVGAILLWKTTSLGEFLNRDALETFIVSLGVYAPLMFMLIYLVGTIIFLPGTPLTILGGILFGSIRGTLFVVVAATLGASIAFLISRYLGKDFVDGILRNKFKTLEAYDKKLKENGLLTMLFLRLVPLFPFNGLNFALGLTQIRFRDYFLGTLIGIIPGSFVLVNIGSSSENLTGIRFYIFIALFLLLAAMPKIYKKIAGKKK